MGRSAILLFGAIFITASLAIYLLPSPPTLEERAASNTSVVYVCTSWKYPGVEHYVRKPDPETDFSGNGFLGFHYYDFFTFRDVKTGDLKQIHSSDSFACEPANG